MTATKKAQKPVKELCEATMEQLHKKLSIVYPTHHWNYVRVWKAYWQLKDILKEQ